MADDVLKSYLIGLGFKLDEAGLRRFTDQITETHHKVRDFAIGFTTLATGIEEAVRRTSRTFESLFFLSQQTGVATSSLRGMQFAFQQIGGSADEMNSALAGLAEARIRNPNLDLFIDRYVPGFKDGKDALEGLAQAYLDAEKQGSTTVAQFASALDAMGVSFTMVRRLAQNLPEYRHQSELAQRALHNWGLDSDATAVKGHLAMESWGQVWFNLRLGVERLSMVAMPTLTRVFTRFSDWLSRDGAQAVDRWGKSVEDWLEKPSSIARVNEILDNIAAGTNTVITSFGHFNEVDFDALNASLTNIASLTGQIKDAVDFVVNTKIPIPEFATGKNPIGPAMRPRGAQREEGESWWHFQTSRPFPDILRDISESTKDSKSGFDAVKKWIFGSEKGTPWVKVENTNEPIAVSFTSQAVEALTEAFRQVFGFGAGVAPEGHVGVAGGGRMPGRVPGPVQAMAKSVYEAISRAEGTYGAGGIDYNMLQGGGHANLVEMTLRQVMGLQHGETPAAGGFQIQRSTLSDAARGLGLGLETKFTPETQHRMADWIRANQGFGAWSGFRSHPEELRRAQELMNESGGGGQFSAGGVNLSRVNQALVSTLKAAAQFLPAGYTVQSTSGERVGGLGGSQHHGGNALDVQIVGPDGKPLANRGQDVTGMYGRLAHSWFNQVARQFPHLTNRAAWGGEFGTSPGSRDADLMHFDFGGRRGHMRQPGNWHSIDSNNNVTINVHGANDPHGVARQVVDAQDRHSMRHAKNLRTAIA